MAVAKFCLLASGREKDPEMFDLYESLETGAKLGVKNNAFSWADR